MKNVDRQFFGGYYLSTDGKSIFGVCPYHCYQQGKVGEQFLVFCLFSELLLNDEPGGKNQESADIYMEEGDKYKDKAEDAETIFSKAKPYPKAVVAYDKERGKTNEEILEKRGYILDDCYAGKTFAEVCLNYPVVYTEVIDEDGNVSQSPSHWPNSQEGV